MFLLDYRVIVILMANTFAQSFFEFKDRPTWSFLKRIVKKKNFCEFFSSHFGSWEIDQT